VASLLSKISDNDLDQLQVLPPMEIFSTSMKVLSHQVLALPPLFN
jgi:hypothetical protein